MKKIKIFFRIKYLLLRQYIFLFRIWIIKKLFTADEKNLLIRAIEDRVENLERIAIKERWADEYSIMADCVDYENLKTIFSTSDWM